MDIIEFLNERLNYVEKLAKEASEGPWEVDDVNPDFGTADMYGPEWRITAAREEPCCLVEDARYIAYHNPKMVLADIEAKRNLIRTYKRAEETETSSPAHDCGFADGLMLAIQVIAAAYSDHPDYRSEWRVSWRTE